MNNIPAAFQIQAKEIELDGTAGNVGEGPADVVSKAQLRGVTVAVQIQRDCAKCDTKKCCSKCDGRHNMGLKSAFSRGKHPNVVDFVGVSCIDNSPCLVYEYLAGGSLSNIFQDKHLEAGKACKPPLLLALSWCNQLARAVNFLHTLETPAYHNSINLQNLLVSADHQTLKLADFSRSIERCNEFVISVGRQRVGSIISVGRERVGSISPVARVASVFSAIGSWFTDQDPGPSVCDDRGSLRFIAPEALEAALGETQPINSALWEKADIYSSGMCMWSMLKGQLPFSHIPDPHLVSDMTARGARPPAIGGSSGSLFQSSFGSVAASAMNAVVCRCWDPEPSQRPPAPELMELVHNIWHKEQNGFWNKLNSKGSSSKWTCGRGGGREGGGGSGSRGG